MPFHEFLFRDLQGSTVILEMQPSIDLSKDECVPKYVKILACGLNVNLCLAIKE